ncbi:hypothetical protein HYX14_05520 [Candidatus Woesearchaeota archaeon]|nr:hypothetical protein [Candidatus Woesearchaeota archaeon]
MNETNNLKQQHAQSSLFSGSLLFKPVSPSLFPFILQLDHKIYPTLSIVNELILSQWFQRNPEFGMIYGSWPDIEGVCIAIPLNLSGWQKLIKGEIKESDLTSRSIFDENKDSALYLHIYHIEKFNPALKKFHMVCFRALGLKVQNLLKRTPLKGISAYCVSAAGINLFYNKLNFHESRGHFQEYLLSRRKHIIIAHSVEEVKKKEIQGYRLITQAKMLVSTPKESSPVWQYLKTKNVHKPLKKQGPFIAGMNFLDTVRMSGS